MDDLFQRLLGPISIILNFPKKIEKFWWKLKEYKPYPCQAEQVVQILGLRELSFEE